MARHFTEPDAVEQQQDLVEPEPALPVEPVREIGSEVRSEVRKDGSIAYFESETAGLRLSREVGS